MELYGTHGTSKSRTTKIKVTGFQPGNRLGKVGQGVYFWSYDSSSVVAKEMAHNWWVYATSKGWFKGDTDSRKSIISVSLTVSDDSEYLDCSDLFFQEQLYETARKHGVESVCGDCGVAAVYESLMAEIEQDLGQTFQVMKAHVPVPSSKFTDSNPMFRQLYWQYSVYVVRKDYQQVIKTLAVDSK